MKKARTGDCLAVKNMSLVVKIASSMKRVPSSKKYESSGEDS